MSKPEFQLPHEAHALIGRVEQLAADAERIRKEAREDLEAIRRRGEGEVRKLSKEYQAKRQELEEAKREIEERLSATSAEIDRDRAAFEATLERDRVAFDAMVAKRIDGAGFVAEAWADYEHARAEALAVELESKSHPARAAADAVRDKGRQLAEARRQAKLAEYVVELYEWHFPWLAELRDIGEAEAYVEGDEAGVVEAAEGERAEDPASRWLSKEEWAALSPAERNQRALDRYLRSRKSPWQLGRDYERFVGYLREQAGCTVTYHGIAKGLEDLGRDVLAEKDGVIEVIQCKRWAQAKTIHEKHVFQLYGTVVLAQIENPDKKVTGTFTTTTSLSEKAREVADYLEIKVEEGLPLADYPRIKCNLGRDAEQIYHLPFDQQYDSTVIEPGRGERYVGTTAEAERLGFRRAWRWRSVRD